MAKPVNPVTKSLAVIGISLLLLVGVSTLLKLDWLLDLFVAPLGFICAVQVLLYTFFALRIGQISCVGERGQIYNYSQKEEPILFYLIVLLYSILALPTALYLGQTLLEKWNFL